MQISDQQFKEYLKYCQNLKGYAAIKNKIIWVLGVDYKIQKKINKVHFYVKYFFIDDVDRNIFKTDASLITKINQQTASVLYANRSKTILRHTK